MYKPSKDSHDSPAAAAALAQTFGRSAHSKQGAFLALPLGFYALPSTGNVLQEALRIVCHRSATVAALAQTFG